MNMRPNQFQSPCNYCVGDCTQPMETCSLCMYLCHEIIYSYIILSYLFIYPPVLSTIAVVNVKLNFNELNTFYQHQEHSFRFSLDLVLLTL